MAKRLADKELTDRNWDQEDESEEAGTFSIASEDVLKNRPIKKAKRRNFGIEGDGASAFKGFKGFSMTASGLGAGTTAFTGLGNGTGVKTQLGLVNGSGGSPALSTFSALGSSPTAKSATSFNGPSSSSCQAPAAAVGGRQPNGSAPTETHASQRSCEYRRQLTALNCSVRDWITKHVNDNPLCDLNPIFRDYERHLASIERQYGNGASPEGGAAAGAKQEGSQPVPTAPSGCGIAALLPVSKDKDSQAPKTVPSGVTFNFGKKVDASVLGSLGSSGPGSFSFSAQGSTTSLFGSQATAVTATGFSFGASRTEAAHSEEAKDENGGEDEESEEPPKPVVNEVKEDDAFYSKKCKLFYKKDNEFKEKGVGTLHLKDVADGKTQLLIRADTNLGNILLNIMVPASMPCSRTGKNNVMIVCVPNPPVDDKKPSTAVPLLIRVKTGEDADELHRTLQKKA